MAKQRPARGRGLFYTRDSGGKHEMTPAQYVRWAAKRARAIGVAFQADPDEINQLIRDQKSHQGDLFLDFDVQGHILTRPGLSALHEEIARDASVSHVFIPRRDRLARPDDAIEGVLLENTFRRAGIHVIYMGRDCPPIGPGERQDIGDLLTSIVEFDSSGKDRRNLAEKIISAQIMQARMGFSIGGRAPFGFQRWLVKADGTCVRELKDGELVRMRGHHVAWLPGPDKELDVVRRILDLLKTKRASEVAAILNKEKIPSPDSGRSRKDNGITDLVSGKWNVSTINAIARRPLLAAVVQTGVRSMGDQLRFTPDGPRTLNESDFREQDGKPKVIRNELKDCVTAPAGFDPIIEVEEHAELLRTLDERAGRQKGIPRSKDPAKNPMGGRVFDMNCGWPMYRTPYKDSFRYKCGYYQQTHGQECDHNCVDGPTSARFVMAAVRQRLLQPHLWSRFETRIRKVAKTSGLQDDSNPIDVKKRELCRFSECLPDLVLK